MESIKLGKIFNVHISPNDIDICYRMYDRNNNGPKAIIVRFQITQTEEVIKIIQVLISIFLLEMLSILIKTLQTISASCLLT